MNQKNEEYDATQNIEEKSATDITEELEDRWLVEIGEILSCVTRAMTRRKNTKIKNSPRAVSHFSIDMFILNGKVRECSVYNDEYKECRSFRGRFQQYFVYGETQSCHQWKKDYDNCTKFQDHSDIKAGVALIESEKARRSARLRSHRDNDTWRRRTSPPTDWDRPLPTWMSQRDEHTYLAVKAKELRGEIPPQPEVKSYCTLM